MMCYSTSCMSFQCWSREITLLSALERPWLGSCSARISLCHDDLKTTVENLIFFVQSFDFSILVCTVIPLSILVLSILVLSILLCPFCSVRSTLSVLFSNPNFKRILPCDDKRKVIASSALGEGARAGES